MVQVQLSAGVRIRLSHSDKMTADLHGKTGTIVEVKRELIHGERTGQPLYFMRFDDADFRMNGLHIPQDMAAEMIETALSE